MFSRPSFQCFSWKAGRKLHHGSLGRWITVTLRVSVLSFSEYSEFEDEK